MTTFIKVTLASQDQDKPDGIMFIDISKIIALTFDGTVSQVITSQDGEGFYVREHPDEILNDIIKNQNTFSFF